MADEANNNAKPNLKENISVSYLKILLVWKIRDLIPF